MQPTIFILALFITLASSLNCYVGVGKDFENEDVIISRYCPDEQEGQYPACIKFTPKDEADKQTARNCGYNTQSNYDKCEMDDEDNELCVCTSDYCNGAGSSKAFW